ncbi:hypothetical protein [Pseudoramibacter alactolyticus]|uniref:hypothetical protein n=1 Tax=Pseudoramibacter alactolyticus TaxID=113287 RepID=UPI002355700D|nr:hypothetical protein [Pseudoramibacter alactolyticus]MBM6968741.1 hypothetical protein [Pseudoramibacter alactolyticus]
MLIYALFSETAQVLDLNLTGETADENKRAFFNRIQRKNSGRKKRVGQSAGARKNGNKKCRCRRTGGSNKSATFNSYFNLNFTTDLKAFQAVS